MAGALSAIPAGSLKPITGGEDSADEKYRSALEKITSALDAREAGNTQQMLLAITQGLLTPGPTGSFGESIGHAAGNVAKLQQAQEASGLENAKMRLQMAQAEREGAREKALSQGMGQLYKQTESGMELQPDVALRLGQITKDPKFLQMAVDYEKTKRLRDAGKTVFTPITTKDEAGQEKTSYQFNPNSVFTLAQASDNPMETIAKYADMVPKLRKAGMLKDLSGDISTPFDAIALMATSLGTAGPAYAEQAKRLAKQRSEEHTSELQSH